MANSKDYVAMGQVVCPICGKRTAESVLIDRRLQKRLPRTVDVGWGMCPEHKKLKEDGYIALVECSNEPSGDSMKQEEAVRTGVVAHVKKEAFAKIFNAQPVGGMVFVSTDVVPMLRKMMQGAEGGAE